MILAPAVMAAEKLPKNAATKCLEAVGLDPDLYRIGNTKARIFRSLYIYSVVLQAPIHLSLVTCIISRLTCFNQCVCYVLSACTPNSMYQFHYRYQF